MTPAQAVVDRLVSDTDVAALVGARVYQLILPQRPTLPAVRVQMIDEDSRYHLRGEDVLTRARVQVDAFADEAADDPLAQADAVASAVHAALSGQRFTDSGSPVSIQVTGVFRADRREMYEADELRLIRISQDYMVTSKHMT